MGVDVKGVYGGVEDDRGWFGKKVGLEKMKGKY